MSIQEILQITAHRPWSYPERSWSYYQEWNEAIFLHWQVDVASLRKHVPDALSLDLFEGKAWLSLVAFNMENIRPRLLPAFPPISNFYEINIRTYVELNGKGGVYFLSIEGSKYLSCKIAKTLSGLPYRHSKIQRKHGQFISHNDQYGDRIRISYNTGNTLSKKSQLDEWLTERYALFQDTTRALNSFEIHHLPWEINDIEVRELVIDYPRFNDLLSNQPDKMQYSKGVKVLSWEKEKY